METDEDVENLKVEHEKEEEEQREKLEEEEEWQAIYNMIYLYKNIGQLGRILYY